MRLRVESEAAKAQEVVVVALKAKIEHVLAEYQGLNADMKKQRKKLEELSTIVDEEMIMEKDQSLAVKELVWLGRGLLVSELPSFNAAQFEYLANSYGARLIRHFKFAKLKIADEFIRGRSWEQLSTDYGLEPRYLNVRSGVPVRALNKTSAYVTDILDTVVGATPAVRNMVSAILTASVFRGWHNSRKHWRAFIKHVYGKSSRRESLGTDAFEADVIAALEAVEVDGTQRRGAYRAGRGLHALMHKLASLIPEIEDFCEAHAHQTDGHATKAMSLLTLRFCQYGRGAAKEQTPNITCFFCQALQIFFALRILQKINTI